MTTSKDQFMQFLYSPFGFVLVVGGAIALLWKPILSKLFSGSGFLSQLSGLFGSGGLVTTAGEGVGYVLEAGEDGVELAVEYLGNQIICGGDSGAEVASQMEQAGITATSQISLLEKKQAGTLPSLMKRFEKYITYSRFNQFWIDLQLDCAGDPKLTEVQLYANAEQMQLFEYKQGGGYLG